MCDCIKEAEGKILESIRENIQGEISGGKLLQTHFPIVKNQIKGRITYTEFQCTLTPTKKDGSMGKPKKQTVNISHAYCPFCGEKHKS